MSDKTILCIDSESLKHPDQIGLCDEDFLSQDWLKTFCTAKDARNAIRTLDSLDQVWVVSSDDMEGINLAAALKHDSVSKNIKLVSFSGSGSEISRCQAAGSEEEQSFISNIFKAKKRNGFLCHHPINAKRLLTDFKILSFK